MNDNNLKLIMSYINYMANVLKIKRAPHYLAVSKIDHPQRDVTYWKSKGVELVDLSTVTQYMREKTPCKLAADPGKKLYTFLYYIRNEKLTFYEDAYKQLISSLHSEAMALQPFLRVSNSTILEICSFKRGAELVSDTLVVFDQSEYDSLCAVLERDDTIKTCFIKSGITSVLKFHSTSPHDLISSEMPTDTMFDLSLNWNYSEIISLISSSKNPFEQAYYYFLIYKTANVLCRDSLTQIDEIMNRKDYLHLTLDDKYHIAILEFNKIALRLLYRERNNDTQWEKLNRLLDSALAQSKAFDYVKKLSKDNGDMIHKLNTFLLEHEEFYMRKSTTLKLGGTGLGKILQIQAVVYDYYYFYKKNYIMLDWFNNVSKICQPYIKAILCTYYPDEYQVSAFSMGRTYTKTYALNIIDINMIIRHISYKEFCSWISYYKVFNLNIQKDIDISELFDHFCSSIRSNWQTEYSEYINLFGKILSLIEISSNDCHRILLSFLKLVTPDDQITVKMAQICIKALLLFVSKHHDNSDETYLQLLSIYINSSILDDLLNMENDYIHLIKILSVHADREICDKCSGVIDHYIYDKQKRAHCLYIFKDILRKNDDNKFKELIIGNIDSASPYEVFDYLSNGIIEFDDTIADYFASRLSEIKHTPGLISYPDHKTELVEIIVCLFISGIIPDLSYFSVLKSYCDEYSYLGFLFDPQSFDYSQIQLSDTMWYNIISTEKYREIILQHKAEFWSKEQEQRISLGFGSEFENRIAYKYLFD